MSTTDFSMEEFISDASHKMPPMKVIVTDKDGKYIKQYLTPAGFQLERYVAEMYQNHILQISFPNGKFEVKIYNELKQFIGTHLGVYQKAT